MLMLNTLENTETSREEMTEHICLFKCKKREEIELNSINNEKRSDLLIHVDLIK